MKSTPNIVVNRRGREIFADYNEINLLETDDRKKAKLEMWIAKNIGDELVKHYPNREWGVRVDVTGGMIIITCDSLSLLCGYHLPINGDNIKQLQKRAMRAGGEILERFNVSRNQIFNPEKLDLVPRDFRDEAISPDAAPQKLIKV